MTKKGKMKISKIKRNNQTTNKMRKQGKLKLQRHKVKPQKQRQPAQQQPEYSSESEASNDEWADMLDEEEQQYILSRLAKEPKLLSNVPENEEKNNRHNLKRKRKKERIKPVTDDVLSDSGAESKDSDSDIEDQYERELAEKPAKKLRTLLPIKTKDGVLERTEECEDTESEEEKENIQTETSTQDDSQEKESESDSGMDGTGEENEMPEGEVVNTVQLLAARRDRLQQDKLRIGALCSSLLESPEKKLKNLYPILYLMEERLKNGELNLHSVRKLATLSAYEVFKDILPDYLIKHQDYSNVKLKKETLALYKYEKELLEFYKRFLQRLEKATAVLRRKKGDNRKLDDESTSLALVSLRCMCGMLSARPNFNYAVNIAQSVTPMLDCRLPEATRVVTDCFTTIFSEDKKGDITLTVVRLINQLVKRRNDRLNPSALDCLLSLRIKDVELDEEADLKHKKKQDEKHKKRIVNLSKKEKKRAKKLKEVERELLETQAQENEAARRKQLTEVTKTVFHIYFRLLKAGPSSKLLIAALNGLAKFTHVINIEFYSTLVSILSAIVRDERTSRACRVSCVRCVLSVLAGAGDALALDPAAFHRQLYQDMATTHAGESQSEVKVILECVEQVTARARRVASAVLAAFAKRLLTLATQLHHDGALACLALLHHAAIQSKAVSAVLDSDPETFSGGATRFDPLLESPEQCGALASAAHELRALRRHYHPAVRDAAAALLQPAHALSPALNKLSCTQILEQYDSSQMAFKPAIPPPEKRTGKGKQTHGHTHVWADSKLQHMCERVEKEIDFKSVFSNKTCL